MSNNVNRPSVADAFIPLRVADVDGFSVIVYAERRIVIRQSLASFGFNGG